MLEAKSIIQFVESFGSRKSLGYGLTNYRKVKIPLDGPEHREHIRDEIYNLIYSGKLRLTSEESKYTLEATGVAGTEYEEITLILFADEIQFAV